MKKQKYVQGDIVDGSASIYKKERLGLVNGLMLPDGRIEWFPEYDLGKFHCGLNVFQHKVTHYFGIMNRLGEIIMPDRYAAITEFNEDRAFACDCTHLINTRGEIIKEWPEHFVVDEFHEGLAILSSIDEETAGEEKIDGYVDTNGDWVIPQIYKNKIETPWIHFDDDRFSDGMIRVRLNGMCGYINRKNEVVIEPQYEQGCRFTSGMAAVSKNGRFGFINKQNQVVLPFEFEDAWPFHEGRASVKRNGKWGCIDVNGNAVLPFDFEELSFFKDGHAPACVGELWGIIDISGQFVVPPEYSVISHFHEGIAHMTNAYKAGVIDRNLNTLFNDTVIGNEYGNLS